MNKSLLIGAFGASALAFAACDNDDLDDLKSKYDDVKAQLDSANAANAERQKQVFSILEIYGYKHEILEDMIKQLQEGGRNSQDILMKMVNFVISFQEEIQTLQRSNNDTKDRMDYIINELDYMRDRVKTKMKTINVLEDKYEDLAQDMANLTNQCDDQEGRYDKLNRICNALKNALIEISNESIKRNEVIMDRLDSLANLHSQETPEAPETYTEEEQGIFEWARTHAYTSAQTIEEFRGHDTVTRYSFFHALEVFAAQYGLDQIERNRDLDGGISRKEIYAVIGGMLWGDHVKGGTPFYEESVNALKKRGIIGTVSEEDLNQSMNRFELTQLLIRIVQAMGLGREGHFYQFVDLNNTNEEEEEEE